MKKFLGPVVLVSMFVVLAGAAFAQMEPGLGHDMYGGNGHGGMEGHHEMMKSHMGAAGNDMKSHMDASAHDMKNHMDKAGHDIKSHADKAAHE